MAIVHERTSKPDFVDYHDLQQANIASDGAEAGQSASEEAVP